MAQSYIPELHSHGVRVQPEAKLQVFAFSSFDVRLLDSSVFKHAQDKTAAYVLSLEPDRLLHRFHKHAGLPVKGEIYGGWESDGLSGHTLGHYLSACSMLYAATGNTAFKDRVNYIIRELEICQQARGTGYVGAIPGEDSIFHQLHKGIIRSSGFDLNGGWSPWYTVHKVMAGLTDAYRLTGNLKALEIASRMGDWVDEILQHLTDEQLEDMRKCEYGGMNDVLVHLYELSGDNKYLHLSYKFHDHFVLEELAKKVDPMPGKHSNTQIPKVTGCARRYMLTASEKDKTIAEFFWETMIQHHTYVIGGNCNYEYCGKPGKLNDRLSDNTCETCNTYNMLKLTRQLFTWNPSSRLFDYYERALYNHILASQNPENGMMCYFIPLRMGAKKSFSTPFHTFTCCVGTGMENHAKYNESIYYAGRDGSLWVNLFIPSELNWKNRGITIRQESRFPEENTVTFLFSLKNKTAFSFRIRYPHWVAEAPEVRIKGKSYRYQCNTKGYMEINRVWKNQDKVEVTFPMKIYTESMPDNPKRIALLYGPLVLAGELGKEPPDTIFGTPVLITGKRSLEEWVQPAKEPLSFTTINTARPKDVILRPFYQVYDQHYNVYWDIFIPEEWRQQEYEAEQRRQFEISRRTVDFIRLGEMQPERDHNLRTSAKSYVSHALGRAGREVRSGGYFEFDMKIDPTADLSLMCTYIGDDQNRSFDILANGVIVATQELTGRVTGRFFDVEYPLPPSLTRDRQQITVRFQAHEGKTAGRVFGCRILKN